MGQKTFTVAGDGDAGSRVQVNWKGLGAEYLGRVVGSSNAGTCCGGNEFNPQEECQNGNDNTASYYAIQYDDGDFECPVPHYFIRIENERACSGIEATNPGTHVWANWYGYGDYYQAVVIDFNEASCCTTVQYLEDGHIERGVYPLVDWPTPEGETEVPNLCTYESNELDIGNSVLAAWHNHKMPNHDG